MSSNKFYIKQISSNSIRGYLLYGDNNERQIPATLKVEEYMHNIILKNLDKTILELIIDAGTIIGIIDDNGEEISVDSPVSINEFIIRLINNEGVVYKKDLFERLMYEFPVSQKTIQRRMKEVVDSNPNFMMNQIKIWKVENNE